MEALIRDKPSVKESIEFKKETDFGALDENRITEKRRYVIQGQFDDASDSDDVDKRNPKKAKKVEVGSPAMVRASAMSPLNASISECDAIGDIPLQLTMAANQQQSLLPMIAANSLDISSMKSPNDSLEMIDIATPHRTDDVLFGRGGGTNFHPGNLRLRRMTEKYKNVYESSSRKEKPIIALLMVKQVRKWGGRFLQKNKETGLWFDVGDDRAKEKVCQLFREKGQLSSNDLKSRMRTSAFVESLKVLDIKLDSPPEKSVGDNLPT